MLMLVSMSCRNRDPDVNHLDALTTRIGAHLRRLVSDLHTFFDLLVCSPPPHDRFSLRSRGCGPERVNDLQTGRGQI